MSNKNKLLILIAFICAGIVLQLSGWLDTRQIIEFSQQYANTWWLWLVLIVLQVVLFTFALAGSLFLWVTATLYPPTESAMILALGATLGGLSAYFFSKNLASDWIEKIEGSKVYRLLQENDNFYTLFALRIMPAFPHALINYSSGILKVKLKYFLPASFIGVAIKSYLFSSIIHQAVISGSVYDLIDVKVLAPLIIFSLLIFVVVFINYKRNN